MATHQNKSGLRRVGTIARREFWTTVKRREFLLVTFGLPFLYAFMGLLVGGATVMASQSIPRKTEPRAVGFLDLTGKLASAALAQTDDGIAGRVYPTLADGQKAVRDRKIRAFVVVEKKFAQTGDITVYAPAAAQSLFGKDGGGSSSGGASVYAATIRRALLSGKTDAATIQAVVRPVVSTRLTFDPETNKFAPPDPARLIARFAVPYVFSLLLVLAVVLSSSYLLHGIVEEKENRVIEVLLSAATHEELLAGKLIGLGAVGLTQMGIWLSGGLLTSLFAIRAIPALASVTIGPGVFVTALLMFLLGFALYAALLAGVGSMGTSWRESQQMSGVAVSLLVVPLMFLPVLLDAPDGGLSRFLSLFPLTAPIGMMLRVAAGGASAGEVALTCVLLCGATYLTVRLAAKLFRLSLLMYGQRPTVPEVWRWLRAR